MTRAATTLALAALASLASLAGCRASPPAPPSISVESAAPRLVAGAPTVVVLRVEPGCTSLAPLAVQAPDDGPAPGWLGVAVDRFSTAGCEFFISNPGTGKPFDDGGGGPTLPATPGGRVTCAAPFDGYQLVLTADTSAPSGPTGLRLEASGCGQAWTAPLTVEVVGTTDLGTFCGWSSGATCAGEGDCVRTGCDGQICAARAGGVSPACPGLACADPVVTGARCGCLSGACTWQPPP